MSREKNIGPNLVAAKSSPTIMPKGEIGAGVVLDHLLTKNASRPHLVSTSSSLVAESVLGQQICCVEDGRGVHCASVRSKSEIRLINHKFRLAIGSRHGDKTFLTRGHTCFRLLGPRFASVRH